MKEDIEEAEGHEEPKTQSSDERNDLRDTLQRLQAEFENYRKRIEKEKSDLCKYAGREIILSMLPILDNLELALKNSGNRKEFEKGVRMVHSQLKSRLEELGVCEISALGERFDPHLHEALMKEACDEASHVTEEFQKGYRLHDRVLRHSRVKVGAKDDRKEQPKEGDPEKGEDMQ